MDPRKSYERTRWAAPGGKGHGIAGWFAIGIGLLTAILAFRMVSRWWLAFISALLVWFVTTGIVGLIWAAVRRVIEKSEGIG